LLVLFFKIGLRLRLVALKCVLRRVMLKIQFKEGYSSSLVYSLFGTVLAGTRAQSGDRYGSGTLHSRQILRGSLPLLSPAFEVPTFAARCLQVPINASAPSSERWNCGREWPVCRNDASFTPFRDLLHAENLRHGANGFNSLPKEGLLRIFSPEKSGGFGRERTRDLG
jgi:hypothetical protein